MKYKKPSQIIHKNQKFTILTHNHEATAEHNILQEAYTRLKCLGSKIISRKLPVLFLPFGEKNNL